MFFPLRTISLKLTLMVCEDACKHVSGFWAGEFIATVDFSKGDHTEVVETQDDTAECPFCGHVCKGVGPVGD